MPIIDVYAPWDGLERFAATADRIAGASPERRRAVRDRAIELGAGFERDLGRNLGLIRLGDLGGHLQ